jgi:hypothetical protein
MFDVLQYSLSTKFEGVGWYRSLQRERDNKD